MLKDNIYSGTNIPNPSIKKGESTKRLINILEASLLIFHNQYLGEITTSEDVLNEYLVKILIYNSKELPLIFVNEVNQKQLKGQNRNVDIGVFYHYSESKPLFTIEAKRLPTPTKHREKEYVIGGDPKKISGGIERFKHNVHGVDLKHSAMVAYIQREDSVYWFGKINEWIRQLICGNIKSALIWTSDDKLVNTCQFADSRISKFVSNSGKTNNTNIELFHFFINMIN